MDVNISGHHPNSTWNPPWKNSRLPVRTRKGEKNAFCSDLHVTSPVLKRQLPHKQEPKIGGAALKFEAILATSWPNNVRPTAFRLTVNRTSSDTSHKSESSLLETSQSWLKRALKQYNPIITKFSQKPTSPFPDSWVPCPVNGPKGAGDWVPQSWSAKLDNKVLLSYVRTQSQQNKLNDVLYKPATSLMYFLQIAMFSGVFYICQSLSLGENPLGKSLSDRTWVKSRTGIKVNPLNRPFPKAIHLSCRPLQGEESIVPQDNSSES